MSLRDFATMPERSQYKPSLSPRVAGQMLGLDAGFLRDEGRRNPALLGMRWVGRDMRFDRDTLLRWWVNAAPGTQMQTRETARKKASA